MCTSERFSFLINLDGKPLCRTSGTLLSLKRTFLFDDIQLFRTVFPFFPDGAVVLFVFRDLSLYLGRLTIKRRQRHFNKITSDISGVGGWSTIRETDRAKREG